MFSAANDYPPNHSLNHVQGSETLMSFVIRRGNYGEFLISLQTIGSLKVKWLQRAFKLHSSVDIFEFIFNSMDFQAVWHCIE